MTASTPPPARRGPRARRGTRTAAVLGAAALGVAGCSAQVQGYAEDGGPAGYVSGDKSVTTWDVGDRLGPIELSGTDTAGGAVDVAGWRGDVVLVNTWYASCPPCRAEAADLVAVANDYSGRGLRAVGIDGVDDAAAAQAYERTFDVPYPTILDPEGTAVASLQGSAPLQAVPTTILLDREGKVAARILGRADPSTLRTLVEDLLAERG
jgi:peroxiredoxin